MDQKNVNWKPTSIHDRTRELPYNTMQCNRIMARSYSDDVFILIVEIMHEADATK